MISRTVQFGLRSIRISPRCRSAAFSLVEVVVAMMITVLAITAFYASAGQALRVMKAGKETVLASQLLQERIEGIRSAPLWTSVAAPDRLKIAVAGSTQSGANLQGAGELSLEKVLHSVMEKTLADQNVLPSAICLGIAGVDRAADEAVVRSIMKRIGYKAKILVVNDALIALEAGIGTRPGIVIVDVECVRA